MAVTVKKKMTVKTVKAVKPPSAAAPVAAAVPAVAGAAPAPKGKKGKKRRLAPVPSEKGPSYTFAAMMGLLAVILLGAMLTIQYFEWDSYHRFPTVFPMPVLVGVTDSMGDSLVPDDEPFDDTMDDTLVPADDADDAGDDADFE